MSILPDLYSFCLAIGFDRTVAELCCHNALTEHEVLAQYSLLLDKDEPFFVQEATTENIAFYYLVLFVHLAYYLRQEYKRRGIGEDIYIATFSDLSLWEKEYYAIHHAHGISETRWLAKHLRLALFRIGSLQFEPLETAFCPLPPEATGLPIINVHIPKGTDLSRNATVAAYQAALHFWHYDKAILMCHSWLLSPALKKLLTPHSRILSFASDFHIAALDESDRQAEERIFGFVLDTPLQYASSTSLQAAARTFLLGKNLIPSGIGWQIVSLLRYN